MAQLKSFRDLMVWQKAIDLAVAVYAFTEGFPRSEQYALTDNIRRCASSISANIAEGYGRGRDSELDYFLRVSYGSLCELESHLELAVRLGFSAPSSDIENLTSEVGKMINGLRSRMSTRVKNVSEGLPLG